jgi:NAD(P)-dependent dehydrogenase (short-subunit alcohol dehydrogenase family)
MARLDGRVAIVTGGAGGLGVATCRRLVAEGARVVVADIDGAAAKATAQELGEAATGVAFDAREPESVRGLVDGVVETHGRLDVLHNNAALTDPAVVSRDGAIIDADPELWDDVYAVNLRGFMLGCKYAVPHMIAGGGGVIVNMSSDAAIAGDVARTAYGCTKAAIITLTQYVATQYGKQNVRCVSITPGAMMTENMKIHMGPENIQILERHHMSARLGTPDDIAALVAFLASDEAGYITGVNIPCDGGFAFHLPTTADMRG